MLNENPLRLLRAIAMQFVGQKNEELRDITSRDCVRLLLVHSILGLEDNGTLGLTEKGLSYPAE